MPVHALVIEHMVRELHLLLHSFGHAFVGH